MADRDENFSDLRKQAVESRPPAPPFPKLGPLVKGKCSAEMQFAVETYDRQVEDWSKARQVSGT